jgi:hypothetical protein
MNRFLLRVFIFNCVLAFIILLIIAQPYQNPTKLFFGEQDCQIPCWQGLSPGITNREEAEAFLLAHDWIDQTSLSNLNRLTDATPAFYQWRWSEQFPFPPPFLDNALAITDGTIGIRSGATRTDGIDRLSSLRFSTSIRVADLWLRFGPPRAFTSAYLTTDITLHEMTLFTLGGSGINVTAHQQCPINIRTLLESPATISIAAPGQIAPSRQTPFRTFFAVMSMRNDQLCPYPP